jgi:hypothetical protein
MYSKVLRPGKLLFFKLVNSFKVKRGKERKEERKEGLNLKGIPYLSPQPLGTSSVRLIFLSIHIPCLYPPAHFGGRGVPREPSPVLLGRPTLPYIAIPGQGSLGGLELGHEWGKEFDIPEN